MADTIREQIISAYLTRLASWTVANGFNYSFGVSAGRSKGTVEEMELPAVVVWPQSETVEYAYGRNICTMTLKLEALAMIGSDNRSVVQERLLGDAIKIMTDSSVIVTSKIDDIAYVTGGPAGMEKAEEIITAITAEFTIKYETVAGDPYSQ
jgi:hypothetical protein